MALVAIVQSYPYDADLGGDASYIVALAEYLKQSGHKVHGFVTDISRGRTSPIYQSAYAIEKFESWKVRRAIRLNKKTFFALHPAHALRATGKLIPSRLFAASSCDVPGIAWAEGEARWVKRKLEKLSPAAIILVHGAIYFAPFLDGVGAKLALLGHVDAGPDLRSSPSFKEKLSFALKHADLIGLNNHEDITYVKAELGLGPAIFVGMGYKEVEIHPDSDEPTVLFVGNATAPNIAGLTWLVSNVWPRILQACPEARLRIVGRAAFAIDCLNAPSIDRVGPVNNLDSEYQRAQLVVAPLISGTSGVKIKVAEAMAHGRPLVATLFGVDARYPHQLDKGAIVANDPRVFADAVINLLHNPALRKLKSSGAKTVFAEQFSYEASYGEVSRWLEFIS